MKHAVKGMRLTGAIDIKMSNGKRWKADKKDFIDIINAVISSYESKGIMLTLRQLYYRLVSSKVIPNDIKVYKKLLDIVVDLREAGYVDWDSIEDRHRDMLDVLSFQNIQEGMDYLQSHYRLPRQRGQQYHLEIWIEKDALSSLTFEIAAKYGVPVFVSHGYNSATAIWQASRRFLNIPRPCKILYLGDHDPSGLDMVRDLGARLRLYSPKSDVEIVRIGLLEKHVLDYDLVPCPLKPKDARSPRYFDNYGKQSWELDALDPGVFQQVVEKAIQSFTDMAIYHDLVTFERADIVMLSSLSLGEAQY